MTKKEFDTLSDVYEKLSGADDLLSIIREKSFDSPKLREVQELVAASEGIVHGLLADDAAKES